MIDPHIDGKVALITGANHGIGAATAVSLAGQGVKVYLTYYREDCPYPGDVLKAAQKKGKGGVLLHYANQQTPVEPLVARIRSNGGKAEACELDLSKDSAISELFDRCESVFGGVDILVNNHTVDRMDTFDPDSVSDEGFGVKMASGETIDAHSGANSRAYALLMVEYFKRFLSRNAEWGRIINVSTDAAHAHAANVSYAASKHAIESYSRSAAVEMEKYGVTVNIVAPGPIQTGYITPEDEAFVASGTPLRRVGIPGDVAEVIVFLASEQARWITGQLIYVGGGWRIGQ